MKLSIRFTRRSKVFMGLALSLAAAAAFAVPAVTHAALGSDRPTKAYVDGMSGFDHVQFNSFTGVTNYGDERQFFTGKSSSSTGDYYDALNGVKSGDELTVRVYVHNNADPSLNESGKGVAKNTRVKVVLPTGLDKNQTAQAFISADNAQPQIIEDDFNTISDSPVGLEYVPGSAKIDTNYQHVALSDDIVKGGVLIGDDNLNGTMPGCFQHMAWVTLKVKVVAPSYSLQKHVKVTGADDSTYSDSVTVKSGDKVDFMLAFKNQGSTNLNDVVIGDRLPVGLTYVPGTTEWLSAHTANKWVKVTDDSWMKGGLGVGDYVPTATAFVHFTAKVDEASKLQCGLNRIVNIGFAKPADQGTIQASAEVDVTKQCETPTPVFSCDLLDVTKDNSTRTVTVKALKTTASGGAEFKTVDLNWGENGVATLNTNTPVGKSHQYQGNGPFTITATAHFSTNGSNDVTATSTKCAQQVSFTTPTTPTPPEQTPPTELVNTGAGNVLGIFAVVTIVGAVLHRLYTGRKFAR